MTNPSLEEALRSILQPLSAEDVSRAVRLLANTQKNATESSIGGVRTLTPNAGLPTARQIDELISEVRGLREDLKQVLVANGGSPRL